MRPTIRILIVEDEPIIAMDLKEKLSRCHYQVIGIADSAETALQLTDTLSPNLILVDIGLQGRMSGIEVAAQIRADYAVPVVFVTAHADPIILEQAQATHPFGYLTQPCSQQDLMSTIEIALSKHQAEVAIQKALERERELNQLKSQFIGLVSHEFRTPLSILLVSLDMLEHYQREMSLDKRQRYFQQARSALDHLREMLEDILVMNEATTKKFRCQPVPLDLLQFCQDLIQEWTAITDDRRMISLHLPPNPVLGFPPTIDAATPSDSPSLQPPSLQPAFRVWLDPKLTRHILSNLVSNAIKYSPVGSEIILELSQQRDHVLFRVQDHGIGIPIADQAYLFQLFYRASNVGQVQGTGLGLAIVKQCLEAHGGHLSFESQVGVGSTFTVRLPNCQPSNFEGAGI